MRQARPAELLRRRIGGVPAVLPAAGLAVVVLATRTGRRLVLAGAALAGVAVVLKRRSASPVWHDVEPPDQAG